MTIPADPDVHGTSRCSSYTLPFAVVDVRRGEQADQLLHTGLVMMYGINSAAGALAQSTSSIASQHLLPGRCKLTSSLLAQPTNSKMTHETPTPRHKSRPISAEEMCGDEERRRGCGAGMTGRCSLLRGRSTDM